MPSSCHIGCSLPFAIKPIYQPLDCHLWFHILLPCSILNLRLSFQAEFYHLSNPSFTIKWNHPCKNIGIPSPWPKIHQQVLSDLKIIKSLHMEYKFPHGLAHSYVFQPRYHYFTNTSTPTYRVTQLQGCWSFTVAWTHCSFLPLDYCMHCSCLLNTYSSLSSQLWTHSSCFPQPYYHPNHVLVKGVPYPLVLLHK